eukprot:Platyproteum_vivax@DN4528_c0_g1_i1.p1
MHLCTHTYLQDTLSRDATKHASMDDVEDRPAVMGPAENIMSYAIHQEEDPLEVLTDLYSEYKKEPAAPHPLKVAGVAVQKRDTPPRHHSPEPPTGGNGNRKN